MVGMVSSLSVSNVSGCERSLRTLVPSAACAWSWTTYPATPLPSQSPQQAPWEGTQTTPSPLSSEQKEAQGDGAAYPASTWRLLDQRSHV